MTAPEKRVIEANVVIKKRSNADPSSSRPATITVTPGKIEFVSIGSKFPPIRTNTEALVKFKRPQGKSVNWASLNFIQNVDAKLNYVNVQTEFSRFGELCEVLEFAWKSKPAVDVFADNADEICVPVHTAAPNATKSTRPTGTGRNTGPRVKVDEEGSAAHPGFSNDFAARRAPQKADALKVLFDDDKKESAKPVHKLPPVKSNRLPASLSGSTRSVVSNPKTTSALNSLLRNGEEVPHSSREERKAMPPPSKPVSSMGMASSPRDSFDERLFHGKDKQKTTNAPSKAPSMAKRMGTKDSLDAERRVGRVKMTPGTGAGSAIEECLRDREEDEDDEKDPPYQPPTKMGNGERRNEKSLTAPAAAQQFDTLFGKKSSNTNLSTNSNAPFRPPLQSSQSRTNVLPDWPVTSLRPWAYKAQANITNSCYMNSTMQILAACPIFVSQVKEAYERLNEMKGGATTTFKIFHQLMKWLTNSFGNKEVSESVLEKMRDQLKTLSVVFEEGGGKAQQDAEECLTAVQGAISDECTGKKFQKRDSLSRRSIGGGGASPVKRVDPECGSSQLKSNEEERKKEEKDYPAGLDPFDLFKLKTIAAKKCNACGQPGETMEAEEHRVLVPVEEEKKGQPWTVKCLQQLLFAKVAPENIDDFTCGRCGQLGATGTTQFVQFGEYIIILMNRFGYNENYQPKKLNAPIRVPLYIETADLINEERTEMHDETIDLRDEKGQNAMRKRRNETVKARTPLAKVMDKTKEWVEENEEELKTEVTQAGEADAFDVFENEDGGEIEEEVEGGWVKEEQMEVDEEDEKTPIKEVIEIESSQSDGEGSAEKTTGSGLREGENAPSPSSLATPPMKSMRMETPGTVKAETRRRSDSERGAAKRSRLRRSNESERMSENRVSTGSRSSLSHSEPSKTEKKSRIEGRRSKEGMSPVSSRWKAVEEVRIEDEEDDEQKARRLSRESKPCWKDEESMKEKRKSDDPFAFDDDDEKNEKPFGHSEKKNRTGKPFVPPTRPKRPLTQQNGTPKQSPVKGDDRRKRPKGENVDPSPVKMEQTGGGKRKDEADELVQRSDEEGKEMEERGEGRKKGAECRLDHVTRRSKAREMKMMNEGKKEEEEGEEGRMSEEKEETEEAREEEKGNIMSRGAKDDEEETSEEVVQETPPEEEEEGKDEKKEEEEKEEDDGMEEGNGEVELFSDNEETEKREEAPATDDEYRLGDSEARVFDTPKNTEESGIVAKDVEMDGMESNADGEVRVPPVLSPNCSPVKKEREEREESPIEVIEEKPAKEKLTKNEYRSEWRKLLIDTDPGPLRDHFFFRPVDDRWMKGQCRLLNLEYKGLSLSLLKRLRSQSSMCKISAEPDTSNIVEIDGDGNCLFRSISWWVTGSQDAHEEMRTKIVDFMCCFPDEFGSRMSGGDTGPPKKYTMENNNRMFELGEWGTHCEIYGAATLLGVDIHTYHEKRWKTYRPIFDWSVEGGEKQVTRKTEVNERTRLGLYISNPENMHYDTVTYMEPVVPVSRTAYRLLGTIMHHGETQHSGHYFADVYDEETNEYLHCNDSAITKISVIEVLQNATKEGYIIVYGKTDSTMKTH